MRHLSHKFDEVGTVDIYENPEISSCIEETMVAIEDRSFEEPEDDYNSKSPNLGFIGFLISSTFRGWQIRQIPSSFDPSI